MKRYTVDEIQNNQFYQMPKFLFNDKFKSLSSDARVLYSLLRDRHQLSIKNNWVNKNNEVYLIYTRDEMANMIGISIKTALKALNQLKECELIEEDRQGINKPNLIYLSHQTLETIGQVNFTYQDTQILPSSNTDSSNIISKYKTRRKYTKKNNSSYSNKQIKAAAKLADALVNGM